MLNNLVRYLKYYQRSTTVYQEHSPFYYTFWKEVLCSSKHNNKFNLLESQRKRLASNQTRVKRVDYGAQSALLGSEPRVAQIAQISVSPKWKCELLYRCADFFNSQNILELGTSLGLSSAYLAMNENSEVTTIEGDPVLCQIARDVHQESGLEKIRVLNGRFMDILPSLQASRPTWDLIFIDGHHSGRAVTTYYHQLKDSLTPNGVMIVDDILWSDEMWDSWQKIRRLGDFKSSLSYRGLGFLFHGDIRPYQLHHDWVDRWMKPWTIIASI